MRKGEITMNQYVISRRNEKGKLVETGKVEARDMHEAIEKVNGVYETIAKIG